MSFNGQWRVIRHYLSTTNLNSEVDKLIQKLKPASVEQWDNLIKKFERAVTAKFSLTKEVDTISGPKQNDVPPKQNDTPSKTSSATTSTPQNNRQNNEKVEKGQEQLNSGLKDLKDLTIENFFDGLKLKKDLHLGRISDSSWKSNKPVVTKSSIHSRTAYVISAIITAETSECLLKRTEHFIDHLSQYPEARDYAIKEGGIRALLRVRSQINHNESLWTEVEATVNEALACLGYTGPTKGPGPNILSIDGGGIRGLIAIEILRHLERLTGKKVHDMFDYIIGVSTGAIIASVIGSGVGTLETANEMYHTLSKKMFGNTSVIGGTSRLVWSHSYYDTEAWENMLKDNLGAITLTQCNRKNTPKLALVSCVVNSGSRLCPFLFRSYSTPYRVRSVFPGTRRAKVWEAVRASAAAPTYFNEFRLEGLLHQDGGIMVNNPTGVGIHEAKLLFGPSALNNGCVISVGTGRALNKHLDYQLLSRNINKETAGTSWKDKFNKILDSATDTEGTHLVLNDLLTPGSYYRFNPPLMEECAMDEINPDKLQSLITDTNAYIRRNQYKFEKAADMLIRQRSVSQKIVDYVTLKSQIMGVVESK